MRLFALTFGPASTASTYYRLLQYEPLLRQNGVEFSWALAHDFRDFPSLAKFDLVILQKKIVSPSILRKIRRYSKRLIYDSDDRIWLGHHQQHSWLTRFRISSRMRSIVRQSDLCLAANQVIASDLQAYGGKVRVVPMSLPSEQWPMRAASPGPLTIGWTGSPGSLPYLDPLWPALRRVQRKHPQVRIAIHCGKAPSSQGVEIIHLPYVMGQESAVVQQFDIGLLPLSSDPFSLGKSPIKALQYMASGTAIVGSPVGAFSEMVEPRKSALFANTELEWENQIQKLINDPSLRQHLQSEGRWRFDQSFSQQIVFHLWLRILREAAGR
ncbi:MAG: glycosyltransferase [Verrucomicrobiales bacterium]|nr:glycosyltransferase [Verrucomicrobiales bacterium]